ncbi:hypothetical protein CVS40_4051 [Lucilia cuprina]|nr:hypothetical protein CVS40_4051 [Lucilia cuprina]
MLFYILFLAKIKKKYLHFSLATCCWLYVSQNVKDFLNIFNMLLIIFKNPKSKSKTKLKQNFQHVASKMYNLSSSKFYFATKFLQKIYTYAFPATFCFLFSFNKIATSVYNNIKLTAKSKATNKQQNYLNEILNKFL